MSSCSASSSVSSDRAGRHSMMCASRNKPDAAACCASSMVAYNHMLHVCRMYEVQLAGQPAMSLGDRHAMGLGLTKMGLADAQGWSPELVGKPSLA